MIAWLGRLPVPVHGDAAWQWVGVTLAAILSYFAGLVVAWAAVAIARRSLRPVRGTGVAVLVEAAPARFAFFSRP